MRNKLCTLTRTCIGTHFSRQTRDWDKKQWRRHGLRQRRTQRTRASRLYLLHGVARSQASASTPQAAREAQVHLLGLKKERTAVLSSGGSRELSSTICDRRRKACDRPENREAGRSRDDLTLRARQTSYRTAWLLARRSPAKKVHARPRNESFKPRAHTACMMLAFCISHVLLCRVSRVSAACQCRVSVPRVSAACQCQCQVSAVQRQTCTHIT